MLKILYLEDDEEDEGINLDLVMNFRFQKTEDGGILDIDLAGPAFNSLEVSTRSCQRKTFFGDQAKLITAFLRKNACYVINSNKKRRA